jgi:hypothetical protein
VYITSFSRWSTSPQHWEGKKQICLLCLLNSLLCGFTRETPNFSALHVSKRELSEVTLTEGNGVQRKIGVSLIWDCQKGII